MPFMVSAAEATGDVPTEFRGAIEVAPVRVDGPVPPWAAGIDRRDLREALVNSLAARGAYVYGAPRYVLVATLAGVEQRLDEILMGLDVIVGVTIDYRLVEAGSGETRLARRLTTADREEFRYLSAAERSRDALENAIRTNIEAFLGEAFLGESFVDGPVLPGDQAAVGASAGTAARAGTSAR